MSIEYVVRTVSVVFVPNTLVSNKCPLVLNVVLFCDSWEEKVPLVQDGLERTWLFHEIGRCYLELKQHDKAQNYGSQSLTAANEISDEKWQLNANVLIAQAECKSKLLNLL